MCGIAGVISFASRNISNAETIVANMNKLLRHRGPDGEGTYSGKSFVFGHTRLSIVDLSVSGHQPMEYLSRYVITYNGEIYNHIELRSELEAQGYTFSSHTDTEVIMAAYDFWGADCVKRFNGMWAFVLFDNETGRFFISRDRFGIKPLYFAKTNDAFVFASEVKAILAHPEIGASPNMAYLTQYLENGPNEYDPVTAFEGVSRFPFACSFLGSSETLATEFEVSRYWTVTPNISYEKFCPRKAQAYADRYYDLLSDAVRLRLRADVKVGSALSGGLDSSSIVFLINKHLRQLNNNELQETFSTVYKAAGTEDCDESRFIDSLAEHLSVTSNQIEPKEDKVCLEHDQVCLYMESPPESTCMSGWHTFKKVAERKVTVTLDGQGADEQLGGYLHYLFIYLVGLPLISFYKQAYSFIRLPGAKSSLLKAFLMRHLKLLFGERIASSIYKIRTGRSFSFTSLNQKLWVDTNTSLVNLIHYSDRVSMGHSVESRMPFMDYRLVEFLSSVPATYKIHNGWTKYIARLAFDQKLPDEVCWRKDKMGWPIPERFWFSSTRKNGRQARDEMRSSKLVNGLEVDITLIEEKEPKDINLFIRVLNIAKFERLFLTGPR